MTVRGTTSVEVQISPEEEKRIVIDYLCRKFDWSPAYYIELDQVVHQVLFETSHSWLEKSIVRQATEMDHNIYEIIQAIRS